MPDGSTELDLREGQALYLPPYALHWVRSEERSVALSCAWRTAATVRAGEVHAANATLLRLGLRAAPVGSRTDGVRLSVAALCQRVRSRTTAR